MAQGISCSSWWPSGRHRVSAHFDGHREHKATNMSTSAQHNKMHQARSKTPCRSTLHPGRLDGCIAHECCDMIAGVILAKWLAIIIRHTRLPARPSGGCAMYCRPRPAAPPIAGAAPCHSNVSTCSCVHCWNMNIWVRLPTGNGLEMASAYPSRPAARSAQCAHICWRRGNPGCVLQRWRLV